MLPVQPGVSREDHFSGALIGRVLALTASCLDVLRRNRHFWEDEEAKRGDQDAQQDQPGEPSG